MNTISYNELYNHCATPYIKCTRAEKSYTCVEPEIGITDAELNTAETHITIDLTQWEYSNM